MSCLAAVPEVPATGELGFPRTLARLVTGRNIQPETLLATDYLNHFNEIIMLLEILPEMPDCLDDVRDWQPKSYAEHFRESVFADRELAILAYENAPARHRLPFDQTVEEMNSLVLAAVAEIAPLVEQGRGAELAARVATAVADLGRLIDRASAIIHGNGDTLEQRQIDALIA